MENNGAIKDKFKQEFYILLQQNTALKLLFFDIFSEGTAYVVGGYFRDILNEKKPRDLDVIIHLPHDILITKIIDSRILYSINRHNGIKLKLDNIEVDMWSIDNNWAFKEKLIKLNPEDTLHSIAQGCFYNYDALVINLHTFSFNIKYYRDFEKTKELDILRKSSIYKNLNPTIEANFIRAMYIKKLFSIEHTQNLKDYLVKRIGYLYNNYDSAISRLIEIKRKYKKYDIALTDEELKGEIIELLKNRKDTFQFTLNLE